MLLFGGDSDWLRLCDSDTQEDRPTDRCTQRISHEESYRVMPHGYRANRNVADKRNRQLALSSALASVGPAATAKLAGRFPSSVTLLTLNIKGAVHISCASQFAEASMLTPADNPLPRL
jgi:hypothetical protein